MKSRVLTYSRLKQLFMTERLDSITTYGEEYYLKYYIDATIRVGNKNNDVSVKKYDIIIFTEKGSIYVMDEKEFDDIYKDGGMDAIITYVELKEFA